MKKIITLLMLTAIFTVFAQTTEGEETLKEQLSSQHEGWKTGGVININFSQAAFSSEWPTGGTNSMTLTSLVSVFANYSDGENIWDNNLDLGYGFSKIGSADAVKSEDKIDLTSKYGRKAFSNWYYAALFNFKSQMTPTTIPDPADPTKDITLSEFMSPGAILLAAGMDYKPNEIFTAFISPLTMKAVFMKDIDTETIIGGYLRLNYKQDIMTNVRFESKFEAFSDYENDPQNMYITWDNLLAMKVNEYLSANIVFSMINTPGIEVVYKEVLGIGLAYKF